ncbi:LysR substrate-binding domain-containing protein [Deinococcus cellulosilyticus]|uniref:LysR family transcriptional regulator n=1 Tax=Deinococcus cellulosilyticus (strain DSM 18568 / NBRC 106333 / KACC 11606 / 5516J-15) TaxID=1223518 RepID=A0A511N8Y4_DEIC1|nr:LysR substrate-binding domain-containing protein [Deinococcus cellulosilyticus]GEM49290.1 LysR family transcriptional regulator [Deinococcus cellulosilyticus NBRC 106333 = KACC 11606]
MPRKHVNLDLDVLRTFVTGVDLGSYGKAAEHLSRSPSAISSQLRKLEQQTGTVIFQKSGRGLSLTEAGEVLLVQARRLLDLNDETVTRLRGLNLDGQVRLGMQEDFAEGILPEVLGRFVRSHPKIRIEVRVARNRVLREAVDAGQLDLALLWDDGSAPQHMCRLAEMPMVWIGPAHNRSLAFQPADPLPLAAFEAPCLFRTEGTTHLDAAKVPWRVAFTSPSLSGLYAAVSAGLGVTIRTPLGLPSTVQVMQDGTLPELRTVPLALYQVDPNPSAAITLLKEIVQQVIADAVLNSPGTPRCSQASGKD